MEHEVSSSSSIRVSTVDNFQGEQSPIVIVSLVRSNEGKRIGFLKHAQRINVLLSRAQYGLILIGNEECMRSSGPAWSKILAGIPSITDGIPIHCSRHGTSSIASSPDELVRLAPHGGCLVACGMPLSCGHNCKQSCHNVIAVPHHPCPVPVDQLCPAGAHRLQRICHKETAPPCIADVVVDCRTCKGKYVRSCAKQDSPCPHCRIERSRRERLAQIEIDKVRKMEKMSKAQSRALLDIDADNAELESALSIQASNEEAQRVIGAANLRKQQAEVAARSERERIAGEVARQIQDCLDKSEKMRKREEAKLAADLEKMRANAAAGEAEKDRLLQMTRDMAIAKATASVGDAERSAAVVAEAQLLADRLRLMSIDTSCRICMDDFKLVDGIGCRGGDPVHFLCRDCFDGYVRSESSSDLGARDARDGQVFCPHRRLLGDDTCANSIAYTDNDIAVNTKAGTFKAYIAGRLLVRERRIAAEIESSFEKRLEQEMERRENNSLAVIRMQLDDRLTSQCPRCKAAFIDFDGCCALTCSRCKCGFCAFCLDDCGTDAHKHVVSCQFNTFKTVFVEREVWKKDHDHWRASMIRMYLAELTPDKRELAFKAKGADLVELGIKLTDMTEGGLQWRQAPIRLGNDTFKYELSKLGSEECRDLWEYNMAIGHFVRLLGRGAAGMTVRQVDVYNSRVCRQQFDAMKREFQTAGKPTGETWVFHGTAPNNVGKIMCGGFRVGGAGDVQVKNGAAYGNGVYCATGPATPIQYGQQGSMVILAKCLMGKVGGREQHDSWPGGGDHHVIKNAHQLLPIYVVHF